ncbi:MAG: type II toxin-antitoxin system VapC family toxin [Rhodospirillaceae bacterium]|nr:type II toxin-antitoxin system VapC family toxin [Rhodospirillaceae bacterium]
MTNLVVDASVVIKWVIDEDGTADALGLRKHKLYAPDLIVAECANVLWKKARRKELSHQEALLAAELIERADLELQPTRRLLAKATKLALALDHPAYDCIYLVLAQTLDCDFVTADAGLQRRARKVPTLPIVRLLAQSAGL